MYTSQTISPNFSHRLTPAERRLTAGSANRAGLKNAAHRSTLPAAQKSDLVTAFMGGTVLISFLIALISL
ncbi:hypothetical protein [Neolewinella antarctica]|uniref:Stress-associated endoplasmic reticulum protein n=1 Tax=Neolewinella antarctica TaxID=442734 RepID=A0ABX0XBP9_9BACT|nr:hypothetical protein [Neolewinella antarctica]NJC26632.1 hypothetical protein [Neolewinella antarctica]